MSSAAKEDKKEQEAPTSNADKAENDADHSGVESNEQEPEGTVGLIKEDGDINWDCPCLGGMAKGPCGTEFRAAFSCFHYSQAEPKGSDCYNEFLAMQECMAKFPEIFKPEKEDDDNPLVDEFDDQIKSETVPETPTDKDSKASKNADTPSDNVQASKQ